MAERKIRIRMNTGIPQAYVGMDDEISPVMIEEWNGERIAWAIAILSALILIPVIYLLYENYQGDDRREWQQQSTVKIARTESPPLTVLSKPDISAHKVLESTAPAVSNKDSLALQSVHTDNNRVEPIRIEVLKPEVSTQQADTHTIVAKPLKKLVPVTADVKIPEPKRHPVVSPVKQLTTKKVEVPDSDPIVTTVTPKTIPVVAQQSQSYRQVEHVSRAHLVSAVYNREPIGEDIHSFHVKTNESTGLFFFTEVNGMARKKITYRWLRDGQLAHKRSIVVTGNDTWRSYTSKLFTRSNTGHWLVEVRDQDNQLLARDHFEVLPPE
jgi:hypothetical protein